MFVLLPWEVRGVELQSEEGLGDAIFGRGCCVALAWLLLQYMG